MRNCSASYNLSFFNLKNRTIKSVAPGCVFCIRRASCCLLGFFSLPLGRFFLRVTANWLSLKVKSRPSYTVMSQTCNDVPSVFQLLPESLNDDGAKEDEKRREDQRYNGHHLSPGGDKQTKSQCFTALWLLSNLKLASVCSDKHIGCILSEEQFHHTPHKCIT